MIDQVISAVTALQSARSRRGHAMRGERRAAVDLLREALCVALPMIAAEATPMPPHRSWEKDQFGTSKWVWRETGRGFLVIDGTEFVRHEGGHDESYEEKGWQVYALPDGSLVELYRTDEWDRGDEQEPRCDEPPQPIGLREAVRRYGAERLVKGLLRALEEAARHHDAMTAAETERARKFQAALAALGNGK